jgi:preprotein translocase subunit SecA
MMNYHINHIKIDPVHLYLARKDLPDNVVCTINKMIINSVKLIQSFNVLGQNTL